MGDVPLLRLVTGGYKNWKSIPTNIVIVKILIVSIGLVHLQLDIGNYGDMDFYQMGMGQNRLAYYYIHILELSSINQLH